MKDMIDRIKSYVTGTRKKILYIAPHLSTGGQPQYLLKKVEHFKKDFDVYIAEYNLASNDYVVQRAQLQEILGDKFYAVGEDKQNLTSIIEKVNPDIIHIEEVPEFFMSDEVAAQIFSKQDRNYFIVTTTHSSNTTPSALKFHPDKFILVSKWSQNKFTEQLPNIPNDIWEYPIGRYSRDQRLAQQKLEFDPEYKHVLMVGLFTPGKNQGEIFEVARQLEKYKIKFHFVGNQASNFKDYWEPIMQVKPENCIIWGERDDVVDFYQACDLFYFSSKLELNPLSIKEALSYKLPSIFRKLDTYLDTYDTNKRVTYINEDLSKTKQIILSILEPEFDEIPGWFAYSDLYSEMVDNAKDGDTFVEVGAWFGKSTNYLASKIKDSGKDIKLTAVDTWKGTGDENLHQAIVGAFNGDIFYEFIDNTVRAGNYEGMSIIKDTSHNAANQYQNNSIDYIMIDAGHSYQDVKDDIHFWYNKIKPGGVISGDDYGIFTGVNEAVDEYFYNQHTVGFRTWKRKKPRIQIKHLLTRPDDMRERVSIQSIKQLEKYGMYYEQVVNTPYEGLAPVENCRRPDRVSKDNKPGHIDNGLGWITGRHYGCYLAHRGALETIDTENFDYTLVFEADAFIYTGLEEFVDIVHKACFISERDNVYYIGLANNPSWGKWSVDDLFAKTDYNQDLAHCYLIPNRHKQFYMDRLVDVGWDVADLWYNHVFYDYKLLRYTTNKVYSKQADGYSLLDETIKTWD